MSKRKSRDRGRRVQQILAIIVLVSLVLGGLSVLAVAGISNSPTPAPTGQTL
jgi:hypothetical protein